MNGRRDDPGCNRSGLTAPTVQPHRDALRIGPGHSVTSPSVGSSRSAILTALHPTDRSSNPASGFSAAPGARLPAFSLYHRDRRRVVPSGGRFGFVRASPIDASLRAWRFHRSARSRSACIRLSAPACRPVGPASSAMRTSLHQPGSDAIRMDLTSASFALHLRFARHLRERSARCVFQCCNGDRCRIRRFNFSVYCPAVRPESLGAFDPPDTPKLLPETESRKKNL